MDIFPFNIILLGTGVSRSVEGSLDSEDLVALLGLNTQFGSLKSGEDPLTCYCRNILLMAKSQTQSWKAPAVQVSLRRN